MYGGRIVETGALRDVVRAPKHPYTRGLLSSTIHGGQRGKRLEAIPGAPPRLDRLPEGCTFAPRCSLADTACTRGEIPLVSLCGPRRALPQGRGDSGGVRAYAGSAGSTRST